jgi:hypothetical protein
MEDMILSGERFQGLCDVYCGSHYDLHRNPKIAAQPEKHLILDALNQPWNNPRIIFCYSCALSTFMTKLHHLTNPFILVSHNEDNNVTEQFLPIANHPLLIHWFAQNVMMRHTKLTWIPIGIANEMWPHGNPAMFLNTCANLSAFPKEYDVFFNFSLHTNPSARRLCYTTLESKGLTFTPPLPLQTYTPILASHKYVICPPGNGVDCHRIWETLMLGGIPVLLRSVFTEIIAEEIPCILLDSWNDFSIEQLHTEYPRLAAALLQLHKSGRLLFSTFRAAILSKDT